MSYVGKKYLVTGEMRKHCGSLSVKDEATHIQITTHIPVYFSDRSSYFQYDFLDKDGNRIGGCSACLKEQHLGPTATNSFKKTIMNLKEKFSLMLKGEPEKSFLKAGITNNDYSLTSDGQAVFLQWLLKKHGDEFKTEVVDPILAEKDEK